MASKRKTSSQSTPSKKQKSGSGTKKAAPKVDFSKLYQPLIKEVLELKDESGDRILADPFIKLPSKKIYPDYYTIVENPLTIQDIQKKLSKGKYSDADGSEFIADFQQIYDNASLYNDPDSWIANDAKEILEFVTEKLEGDVEDAEDVISPVATPRLQLKLKPNKSKKAAIVDEELVDEVESPAITVDDLPELCTKLLDSVIDHKFPGLGVLSDPFLDEIDRKEYPDYFKIIQHPTSFNKVLSNLKKKNYFLSKKSIEENLAVFKDDTLLIFSNAQLYNDPGSLIYQDSENLQKFFEDKFEELLKKAMPAKKSGLKLKIKTAQAPEKLTVKIERRGRKKKEEVKPEVGEEDDDGEDEDGVEIEEHEDMLDTEKIKEEGGMEKFELENFEEYNALGKTSTPTDPNASFIQLVSICSSSNTISQISNQIQHNISQGQPEFLPLSALSAGKQVKYTLFPTHEPINSVLFEFKFPTRGYNDSSYSFTLPQDANSLVSLKVSLNEVFKKIKASDTNAQFVNAANDEDFQCRLFLNDEEVNTGGEIFEGDGETDSKLLNFQYDLKLSQGLNMLTFETKVAPQVSKKLKEDKKGDEDLEEGSGRFTRHQLQQIKMSWDVEKVNFIIINTLN